MSTGTPNQNNSNGLIPTSCPFCKSHDVRATGKVTAASYYRCNACDQVWHPERLVTGRSLDYGGRF